MEIREAYKQKMVSQLKEWSAQINLLEAKAKNAGVDMKTKRAEVLQALRAKQSAASEKMKQLDKAGGEAWDQARETTNKFWADLKAGVADARSRFR